MTRILVAGGTGALGSALVDRLVAEGSATAASHVRGLSRHPPSVHRPTVEWVTGDLTSGEGVDAALAGVDIVVNCSGNARRAFETDVQGVERLLEAARRGGVRHFFHVSIVGIEHIDTPFYGYKVQAEAAVASSGVPYSIQRLPQFHTFVEWIMTSSQFTPQGFALAVAPTARFQPIDTRDASDYLAPLLAETGGRLPDVGGPEILTVEEIARAYLQARGEQARGEQAAAIIEAEKSIFSPAAVEAYRQGLNTVPHHRTGRITWADYVRERYGAGSSS